MTRLQVWFSAFLVCCAGLACTCLEAQETAGWGTIKGVVSYRGPKVSSAVLEVFKDKDVCTANGTLPIRDEELVVDEATQGLRWVALWIKSPVSIHPDLQEVAKSAELSNANCVFRPQILPIRKGTILQVSNRDSVAHNAKITGLNNGFNPLIPAGSEAKPAMVEVGILASESRPVLVTCDLHPWMKSYLLVLDHPYYAVSNQAGEFEIRNVPAGQVSLISWHGKFGWGTGKKNGQEVQVEAGKTIDVRLSFAAP